MKSPLLELLESRGGRPADIAGRTTAGSFGDPMAESEALRTGCGLVDRPWIEVVRLRGEDRIRFLQGLVTCDVAALAPGAAAPGFLVDVKGRILSDFELQVHEDRLDLRLPAGRSASVVEHLSKYVLADRVETTVASGDSSFTLVGPEAPGALEGLGFPIPGRERSHVETGDLCLFREADREAPVFTFGGPSGVLADVAERLLVEGGAAPAGFEAWEILRVEAGVLRWEADFDASNFPQETGRAESIDFEKGCYLGQEVVARIHYRGGVQKGPRGLRLDAGHGDPAEAIGRELLLEDRAVGRLGSAVPSPRHGPIGVAVLHRRGSEPGTLLDLGDGRSATVVELPFA